MPLAEERLRETAGWEGATLASDRVVPDRRRMSTGAARHSVTRSARAAAVPPTTAPA